MQSGKLDRQATFQRRTVTGQDPAFGTDIIEWVPIAYLPGSPPVAERFWVNLQDVLPSRSESVKQGLASYRDQLRLRMRWRADIDSTLRVIVHYDTDQLFQIVAGPVEVGGRKNTLELMLEKYSTHGTENV